MCVCVCVCVCVTMCVCVSMCVYKCTQMIYGDDCQWSRSFCYRCIQIISNVSFSDHTVFIHRMTFGSNFCLVGWLKEL